MKRHWLGKVFLISFATAGAGAVGFFLDGVGSASRRAVLVGETAHEFANAVYEGEPIELRHTFSLVNQTNSEVRIVETKSSCGCTVAQVSQEIVAPGDSVSVEAVMTLSSPGRRDERIWLVLDDGRVQTLTLSGAARAEYAIHTAQHSVRLEPGSPATIVVVATGALLGDQQP